jgi:hypothetical protein
MHYSLKRFMDDAQRVDMYFTVEGDAHYFQLGGMVTQIQVFQREDGLLWLARNRLSVLLTSFGNCTGVDSSKLCPASGWAMLPEVASLWRGTSFILFTQVYENFPNGASLARFKVLGKKTESLEHGKYFLDARNS